MFNTERPSVSQLEALGREGDLEALGTKRCIPPKKYFHGPFPVCGSPWKVSKIVCFPSINAMPQKAERQRKGILLMCN